ncbi:MAG: tetratricopeptide repeat protein [Elusimicrobia bacterium]|nr:tetratricopeptide repeat protein [Elusimicrobiota bacterium]
MAVFFILYFKSCPQNPIQTGAFFGAVAIIIHSAVSVNMRFTISSLWAFFLMGLALRGVSGRYKNKEGLIDRRTGRAKTSRAKNKAIAVSLFALLLIFWSKSVLTPLSSQKKLSKEIDFFDTEREYSKKELKKLAGAGPENALIYYKLGWIQAKDKEFNEAITNFKKAIIIDDSLTGAFNNLGNIYFTLGNKNEAAKYYIEALKRNPDMPDAHFNLGYIYYYQGRLKEATKELNIVLKLDPENYKAKMMLDKMVQ